MYYSTFDDDDDELSTKMLKHIVSINNTGPYRSVRGFYEPLPF